MKLPGNRDAELQALSTAITKKTNFYKLMEYDESLFCYDDTVKVFNVMKECYEVDQDIDYSLLSIKLKNKKIVSELANTYSVINYQALLDELERLSFDRKLMRATSKLYESIKSGSITRDDFASEIIKTYDAMNRPRQSDYTTIEQLKTKSLDEIFEKTNYIKTGVKNLDKFIVGLFNKQLIVIGGRQKKGKTTLALNIAKNLKKEVLFFSLEMGADELYSKLLASIANVEAWKIEADQLTNAERERVLKAHNDIDAQITIFDNHMTLAKIKSAVHQFMKKKKPAAVFIDYVQLISGAQGENQNIRVSLISRTLKLLAKKYNVPFVVISQLSRDSEKQNRRPVSSDLRDSGSLEQDADLIIFSHENEEGETEIIIGDGRKCKKGIVKGVKFIPEYSRFEDVKEMAPGFNECQGVLNMPLSGQNAN